MDERETLLQKFLDGEADADEAARAEALIAEDPELAADLMAMKDIGKLAGDALRAQAETVDFSAMWSGIEREIDWHEAGLARSRAASAELVGVDEADVSWRDSFQWLLKWRFLSAFAAVAAMALLVPRLVEWANIVPLPSDKPVGQIDVVAQAPGRFDGVEVESVQAADTATVVVFQGGDDSATFIWVSEADPADEGRSI